MTIGNREGGTRFPGSFPKRWQLERQYSPFLTGREEILRRLPTMLSSGNHAVALVGPKGIGKTELASTYAFDERSKYMKGGVLLLDASSEETLETTSQQFAHTFLRRSTMPGIDTVVTWLKRPRNALVILDQVADAEIARQFLSKNHLLLTSESPIDGIDTVKVDPLSEIDGALLLLKRSSKLPVDGSLENVPEVDRQIAIEISKLLSGTPLQIMTVGGYIEETQDSLANIIQFITKDRTRFFQKIGLSEKKLQA